jgi:hypothetical protein
VPCTFLCPAYSAFLPSRNTSIPTSRPPGLWLAGPYVCADQPAVWWGCGGASRRMWLAWVSCAGPPCRLQHSAYYPVCKSSICVSHSESAAPACGLQALPVIDGQHISAYVSWRPSLLAYRLPSLSTVAPLITFVTIHLSCTVNGGRKETELEIHVSSCATTDSTQSMAFSLTACALLGSCRHFLDRPPVVVPRVTERMFEV